MIKEFFTNIGLFFQGALDLKHKSRAILEAEAQEEMDSFMLTCFSDVLGLPLPISYYTLELLPFLEDEFDDWEMRMLNKKSVWEHKASVYDMDI